jgi:hypothetical protein
MTTMVDYIPVGMRRGARVSWKTASGLNGSGEVISEIALDPWNVGHVLVAVDAPDGEEHRVIYCAVTWLTVVSEEIGA